MQTEHLSPGPTAHLHARSVAPGPVTPRLCHGGRPVHGFMDVVCFSCGLWFYAHYLLTLSLRAGLALRSLTRHVVQTHTYMRACVRTHTHTDTHTHTHTHTHTKATQLRGCALSTLQGFKLILWSRSAIYPFRMCLYRFRAA